MIANKNKQVIVGLGMTGLSCARYLASKGHFFSVVDSRENPPNLARFKKEFPDVAIHLGPITDQALRGADELVVSPGVSLQEPAIARAIDDGIPVCGDIDLFRRELFRRQVAASIIAITGSNGKSTVTTLVADMARAAGRKIAVGGNIGVPVLDLLHETNVDLYVLELSSFQLERSDPLDAQVVTILNISDDHMDRHIDMYDYQRAKQRILRGCRQVVLNRDDNLSASLLPKLRSRGVKVWTFGLDEPNENAFGLIKKANSEYLAFGSQPLLLVTQLALVGRHNIANALAALALIHAVGLPFVYTVDVLRQFHGLPHRCQWISTINDVHFYNDSKGTNVGAVIATIKGLQGSIDQGERKKIVLIAGGQSKQADFSPLLPIIQHYCRAVVLIGETADTLDALIDRSVPTMHAMTMEEAVGTALLMAMPGDNVLLSPACASFDMFDDYQQRGDAFVSAVKALTVEKNKQSQAVASFGLTHAGLS